MPQAGDIILTTDIPVLVSRGRRTTATGNITTTETGVLRLDDVAVRSGWAYEIFTNNINLDTSVANDIAAARLRVAFSASPGTSATTSSTQIQQMRNTIDDATNSNIIPMNALYLPGSTGYLSVLLSAIRVAGSGNIVVFASGTDTLELMVRELGEDPGDSGVVI
jgi:hypothetical protein